MDPSERGRELFERAVRTVDPYARELLAQEGTTWGPRFVRAAARLPGVPTTLHATLGHEEPWREEWGGEVDFTPIAENKLAQALRAQTASRELLGWAPWNLESGDYLAAGGVRTTDGAIAVGVSGAVGAIDEAVAQVLLVTMVQLYRLWFQEQRDAGVQRLD